MAAIVNAVLRAEALAWIDDCFSDAPAVLSDDEIIAAVGRHYEGGWRAFRHDCAALL